MTPPTRRRRAAVSIAAGLALTAAGCGSDDTGAGTEPGDESLVVYVGRSEELVGPLVTMFEEETGIEAEARYAGSTELAAQMLDEGDATPAEVFLSQDAGALGALSDEGMLAELPDAVVSAVPQSYASADGTWVGVTGRARVVAYDGEKLTEDEVPGAVDGLVDPQWSGRVGIAPTNASFQSFVTAFRVSEGDDAARAWLDGMVANDVQIYENNVLILDAVNNGQLDVGLINHYYWFERAAEGGAENMRAQLKFLDPRDPGALVNVTGAGILEGSADDPDALAFVEYLLSEEAQTFFAEQTFEYPLIDGVPAPEGLPALDDLQGPDIDLADLASLEETTAMLADAGLT
jgi:iron(III) transport system substrate-binding protein